LATQDHVATIPCFSVRPIPGRIHDNESKIRFLLFVLSVVSGESRPVRYFERDDATSLASALTVTRVAFGGRNSSELRGFAHPATPIASR